MLRDNESMIASSKVTEQAERRWTDIVERFRTACILHREGQEAESRRIIKEEMPGLIKSWIKLLPPSLKEDAKADLRDMFTKEQSLVDQGLRLQNVFKQTLMQRIIPQVEEQVAAKYRSFYIREQQKRALELESSRKRPWLQPPSGSDKDPVPSRNGRVSLGDVSRMIDAVQRNDSEILANAILPLDDIVGTLNRAHIDAILTNH